MNFLAHLYLSGNDNHLAIGNFIADSVKGLKALENFPIGIQNGIILHRKIDSFMDNHHLVLEGTRRLRPNHGKFAPIIMDIFYDHFLANTWETHSEVSLNEFIENKYSLLEQNLDILPTKIQHLFPIMKKSNWLMMYKNIEGLEEILKKMDNRMQWDSQMHLSINELTTDYVLFQDEFDSFFEEIKIYVIDEIKKYN